MLSLSWENVPLSPYACLFLSHFYNPSHLPILMGFLFYVLFLPVLI